MLYRLFFGLSVFVVGIYARDISCAVTKEVHQDAMLLLDGEMKYTKSNLTTHKQQSNLDALQAVSDNHADFAIVRADVLYAATEQKKPNDYDYVVISKLPFKAKLFLIQDSSNIDIYLDELQGRLVSVDSLGDSSGHILKEALKPYNIHNSVALKAIDIDKSLDDIYLHKLDVYIGFLRKSPQNNNFNIQTIFSEETISHMKMHPRGTEVGEFDIEVSYMLIARANISNKEAKAIILRLKQQQLFDPPHSNQYGDVNIQLMNNLEDIDKMLVGKKIQKSSSMPVRSGNICISYRHGFLKLLRRKPNIRKVLMRIKREHPKHYHLAKNYMKNLENILLEIDAQKSDCNGEYIQNKREIFLSVEEKIKRLL